MPELFNSSFGLKLTIREMIAEIVRFMKSDPKRRYRITIGTDSELLADKSSDFVNAIVVHRIGNGGRYFWRHCRLGKFHTLRDRIIKEVMLSLDAAKELLEILKPETREDASGARLEWEFEIHADIGERGETKVMLKEVVAMIRAHNFEAKTKPESYAASKVADRHV